MLVQMQCAKTPPFAISKPTLNTTGRNVFHVHTRIHSQCQRTPVKKDELPQFSGQEQRHCHVFFCLLSDGSRSTVHAVFLTCWCQQMLLFVLFFAFILMTDARRNKTKAPKRFCALSRDSVKRIGDHANRCHRNTHTAACLNDAMDLVWYHCQWITCATCVVIDRPDKLPNVNH